MPPPTNNPPIHLTSTPLPSSSLLTLLTAHLPHSLPVLRRLQFAANFPGRGSTPHTHVLHARFDTDDGDDGGRPFAVACVDLSRGPETQVWVYASLEDRVNGGCRLQGGVEAGERTGGRDGDEDEEGQGGREVDLVMAVLRRVRGIAAAAPAAAAAAAASVSNDDGGNGEVGGDVGAAARMEVLVGSLHETVRQGLLARGVKMGKPLGVGPELEWEFCNKWLFRVEDLPRTGHEPLPEGMRWDRARKGDVEVVRARTSIDRKEATLLMLPSVVVRLHDGTPVAWGFMGLDGTIMSVHVEEPYRRLGLAKVLACKLMREHLPDYGDDGWGAADVFVENHKSQAWCRSIGGRLSWTMSWAIMDLRSVEPNVESF